MTLNHWQPGLVFALERMAEEDTAAHLWDSMGRLPPDATLAPWEILCLYQIS